jgi:hypothetical protein
MGGDEVFVLIFCGAGAFILWMIWLVANTNMTDEFYRNGPLKSWAAGAGTVAAIMLFVVLKLWASHDVRDAPEYLLQYWLMGAFVAAVAGVVVTPMLGISYRIDVCENRNPAAMLAWSGAIIGATFAFAGSNIGDGPGWWVVVFCSFLSCGFLVLMWIALELFCHVTEAITVDRDMSAGVRFGGLLIGMGIVAGRGAAGNWEGSTNAIHDFIEVVAPASPLILVAMLVEWVLRRVDTSGARFFPSAAPGALYAVGGLLYVVVLKPW